jgi:hypothetical protein
VLSCESMGGDATSRVLRLTNHDSLLTDSLADSAALRELFGLEDVSRQILVLGELTEMLVHVVAVDDDAGAIAIGGIERDGFQ